MQEIMRQGPRQAGIGKIEKKGFRQDKREGTAFFESLVCTLG
jgi:hypothetical protein